MDLGTDERAAIDCDSRQSRQGVWEEHIRRWRSGGLTQAEYCRRNGLKWSAFHYWKKRLRNTGSSMTLVQVPVGLCTGGVDRRWVSDLILVLGDRYRVEVGDRFNPSTLVRLIDTLGRL